MYTILYKNQCIAPTSEIKLKVDFQSRAKFPAYNMQTNVCQYSNVSALVYCVLMSKNLVLFMFCNNFISLCQ